MHVGRPILGKFHGSISAPQRQEVFLNHIILTLLREDRSEIALRAELSDDVAIVGSHQNVKAADHILMLDVLEKPNLSVQHLFQSFAANLGKADDFDSDRAVISVVFALEDFA